MRLPANEKPTLSQYSFILKELLDSNPISIKKALIEVREEAKNPSKSSTHSVLPPLETCRGQAKRFNEDHDNDQGPSPTC